MARPRSVPTTARSLDPRRRAPLPAARRWGAAALWAALAAGCEGEIGEPSPLRLSGGDAGSDDASTDAGVLDAGPSFDPFAGGGATIGVLCGRNGPETRLVLTREPPSCQRHAELISGATPAGDQAVVTAPLVQGPTQFTADAELCLEGDCANRAARVSIDVYGPTGALGRWSIALDGRSASGPIQASVCNYDAFLPGPDPRLVPDLGILEVAIYQGVRISLVRDGAALGRRAPVVAGRPALLRVFVAPRAGFLQRTVEAELRWDPGDGRDPVVRSDTFEVAISSREDQPATTFDFELEPELVTASARWSVTLRSPDACAGSSGDTSGARYPASGDAPLAAEEVGVLDVVLVPFRYLADGSRRLPDTSPEQLERYRRRLFSLYPVSEVRIVVRPAGPVDLPTRLAGNGAGWSETLRRLLEVRATDGAPPTAHYYGIFAPAESLSAFCGGGCIAGLGTLAGPADAGQRGAIGLGFTGTGSTNTCAHELGHVSGRQHAPCRVDDPDPGYPSEYPEASIGVWGYDLSETTGAAGRFKDPSRFKDMMSYCDPEWISDYNYGAIATRLAFVNRVRGDFTGPKVPWRAVALTADGPRWGPPLDLSAPPGGDPIPIAFLDARGAVVAETHGTRMSLDHLDERILFVPQAPAGVGALRLEEGVVLAWPAP